jgi:hypothetical protein
MDIQSIHAALTIRQDKRNELAKHLRHDLEVMRRTIKAPGLMKSCLRAYLYFLEDKKEMYPSTHPSRLLSAYRQMVRAANLPLPWEQDKNWVNPASTESYSACGYADGIWQDREDAAEVAQELLDEWTVSLCLNSGEPI